MNFRSDPRPKWRRTQWAKSPAGFTVEIDVPRGRTPYWRQAESDARRIVTRMGYQAARTHLGRGPADIMGIGPDGSIAVQVKSTDSYSPHAYHGGLADILQVEPGPGVRRFVFCYARGLGLVAAIEAHADGTLSCESTLGKARLREDVLAAMQRVPVCAGCRRVIRPRGEPERPVRSPDGPWHAACWRAHAAPRPAVGATGSRDDLYEPEE